MNSDTAARTGEVRRAASAAPAANPLTTSVFTPAAALPSCPTSSGPSEAMIFPCRWCNSF